MDSDQKRSSDGITRQPSSTERAIAALWREALQIPELPSATDNFFALGGDSMTMTMVEFRIKEELSVALPPGALLEAQSLRELSALVDEMNSASRNSLSGSVVDHDESRIDTFGDAHGNMTPCDEA